MLSAYTECPDILIVDDDSTVVIALKKTLEEFGRIRFALDAEQALIMINETPPNLILLDMGLPDINGLDICARLKQDPETAEIPILFITSNIEVGFEEKVFDVGAADYILKPLNPRVVSARVKTHLAYHRAIQLLDKQAHTDSMTNLANRRAFDKQVIIEFKRALRATHPLTVALIDIDEFKKYNDHFGHIAGDECLKSIAKVLGESVKRPADMAARYGGEEFAFILPHTDTNGARKLLYKLLKTVEQLNLTHAPDATYQAVTVSIGYSTLNPENVTSIEHDYAAIIEAADTALYESKQKGRNCLHYNPLALAAPSK